MTTNDETRCLRVPQVTGTNVFRSLSEPVRRGSTVVFASVEEYRRRRDFFYDGYSYGLYGTPTTRALEAQIAALEDGARTIVVPSGMAAIALVILAVCDAGSRVLLPDTVYDPVRTLAGGMLARFGIEAAYYDPRIGAGIDALIDSRTQLVWVESPGSVTMEVQDIPAITRAAHSRGVFVGADNSWATPLRFKPIRHGVDFSMSALSKYIGGHSDLLMGSVTVADEALYRRLRDVSRHLGYGVSPDDCSLALRGVETLAVRLDRIEATALRIARQFEGRPGVVRVLHPALSSHPDHAIWARDFSGASGVFSVVLDPGTRPMLAEAVEALEQFAIGASWGGTKSVIAILDPLPPRTAVPPAAEGPYLRLSIGLEHPDDLTVDLDRALAILTGSQSSAAADREETEEECPTEKGRKE